MTIAEAGPAGRIKHNFSVTVRGVGFSTLMISSAPQSRPLSHPGLLLPRARFSLSFGFATPSLLGIHFHAFSWATRPLVLSFPYCSSPAPLQSRSFTVCPIFPLSLALSLSLSLSLSLCAFLLFRFFILLSRALITNFSLFSRNSRSSEQLSHDDSSFPLGRPSLPLFLLPFSDCRSPFFSASSRRSFPRHPLSSEFVPVRLRYSYPTACFPMCSFPWKRNTPRETQIYTVARRAEDREIL